MNVQGNSVYEIVRVHHHQIPRGSNNIDIEISGSFHQQTYRGILYWSME